jgi:hypothetical protein
MGKSFSQKRKSFESAQREVRTADCHCTAAASVLDWIFRILYFSSLQIWSYY